MQVLDADNALLWTAKLDDDDELLPEFCFVSITMDWKGQLMCAPEGIPDVYICKQEQARKRAHSMAVAALFA
jgi:hypothetical protein